VARIIAAFGANAVLFWGAWGRSPNLRHQPPSPGIGLRRQVHRKLRTITTVEHYTSSVCARCEGRNLTKPLTRTRVRKDAETGELREKTSEIHHLLRCQNADCGCWWNRDVLGARNILKQGLHCLRHARTAPCFARPAPT
jgi:transposase